MKRKAKIKAKSEKYKIYKGRILNPITKYEIEEFVDGALVVNEKGRIEEYGNFAEIARQYKGKIIDKSGYVIIPGLVDCHLHLPQLDLRGKHGATLLDWLEKYIFSSEMAFANIKVVDDVAKRFFKKLILNGTTTSSIYTTIHAKATDHVFKIAKASGLRAIIGKVMMDQYSPKGLLEDTRTSLKESEKLCEKWHGAENRLYYAYTPRFVPTCSENLLENIGKLADESGAYIQTHIAETRSENDRVRELYPDYEDYTSVYEENGCLTSRTILGHAIYLSEDEMLKISRSKSKIAHCPTSNFFLKSGRMPIELIEEHGITLGLGTDVGAGTSMSLFTTMMHADYIQPKISVSPNKAFYLATLGGAKTLSLEKETGNLAAGKAADFCVIDIREIDPRYNLKQLSAEEILSLLMYRANGGVVKETYLLGNKLDVDGLKMN